MLPFALFEKSKNFHDFSDIKKNKWQIKKYFPDSQEPWMYHYVSTARYLYRTQWMLSFSEKILGDLSL